MVGVNNTLYPPVLDTYMPAFIKTSPCRIYFTLSEYNNASDIKYIQIAVNNQYTNASMLDPTNYPSEVKVINFAEARYDNNKYYIDLPAKLLDENIIINGAYNIDQYYKIQLRFVHQNATSLPENSNGGTGIENWLVKNQQYFSEWSRVCLIRAIAQPYLELKGFNSLVTTSFTMPIVDIVGQLVFPENSSTIRETLESYQITITDADAAEVIYQTDLLYSDSFTPNEINHPLACEIKDGVLYNLTVTYHTNNGYSETVTYIFTSIQASIEKLDTTIVAVANNEEGFIEILIGQEHDTTDFSNFMGCPIVQQPEPLSDELPKESEPQSINLSDEAEGEEPKFSGSITIRRASSETNFTIWEDIHTFTLIDEQGIHYSWKDCTAKSGVWYNYCIQKRDIKGNRGIVTKLNEPVMLSLEHMFLTHNGMQLKIKYNPVVNNVKHVLGESKTDTIGSQYPFIRRNSKMNYRQFSISGLITSFCDENNIFITKKDIYKYDNIVEKYEETAEFKSKHYNYIYERDFRDKVVEFLSANTVKLFRSRTEGNILVKLMDINLTPNTTLGRMLYTFTANAIEVDECSIANYNKYLVQSVGEYQTAIETFSIENGYMQETFPQNTNIFTVLNNKYKNDVDTSRYIKTVKSLKWLRLDFESEPYQIGIQNGIAKKVVEGVTYDSYIIGYLADINGTRVIINKKGYYELHDEDTEVTTLSFPYPVTVSISYVGNMRIAEDPTVTASQIIFNIKAAQMRKIFNYKESQINGLKAKYYRRKREYYQDLLAINEITIEADPGTIVQVKDATPVEGAPVGQLEGKLATHIINFTGVLHLSDPDATILDFSFAGRQLVATSKSFADAKKYGVRDNEFIDMGKYQDNGVTPIKNGLYTKDDEIAQIYYHGSWMNVSIDKKIDEKPLIITVKCPVEATVDYIYQIQKGEY